MRYLELLFVIALVLYTFVIWYHKARGVLSPFMIWLFGVGFSADMAGTVFVCVGVADRWIWNFHTISGFASLVIMGIHFLWAILATLDKGNTRSYFERFSVWAWLLWLSSFLSGIPR